MSDSVRIAVGVSSSEREVLLFTLTEVMRRSCPPLGHRSRTSEFLVRCFGVTTSSRSAHLNRSEPCFPGFEYTHPQKPPVSANPLNPPEAHHSTIRPKTINHGSRPYHAPKSQYTCPPRPNFDGARTLVIHLEAQKQYDGSNMSRFGDRDR